MDFNLVQRLAITRSIIELINHSGSCGLVKNRLMRGNRFEDCAVVFYENNRGDLSSSHNCLNACEKGIKLKKAMLNLWSLLNIILLLVQDAARISRERVTRQRIEVSSFRGKCTYTIGFVKLDLTIGPERTTQTLCYQLQTTYHLFLRDVGYVVKKQSPLVITSV